MVTNGSMEAAALLFEHVLEPGDRVIVEQPSYDRTLLLLGRAESTSSPVPLESDGVDVAASSARSRGAGASSPTSSPTSTTRPAARSRAPKRRRLVELAGRARLHAVRGRPLPADLLRRGGRDHALDGPGREVIHASSFSKTVSPGVRVGYLAGPADEIA